jgi:hypothetical protein
MRQYGIVGGREEGSNQNRRDSLIMFLFGSRLQRHLDNACAVCQFNWILGLFLKEE